LAQELRLKRGILDNCTGQLHLLTFREEKE